MTTLFINISTGELAIVFLIAMLLFGPKKLPDIVRFFGKLFNDIKHASDEVKKEILQGSQGLTQDLQKMGHQVQKEAQELSNQVIEAIPRPSIRTFEKATNNDIPPAPKEQNSVESDGKKSIAGKDRNPAD